LSQGRHLKVLQKRKETDILDKKKKGELEILGPKSGGKKGEANNFQSKTLQTIEARKGTPFSKAMDTFTSIHSFKLEIPKKTRRHHFILKKKNPWTCQKFSRVGKTPHVTCEDQVISGRERNKHWEMKKEALRKDSPNLRETLEAEKGGWPLPADTVKEDSKR